MKANPLPPGIKKDHLPLVFPDREEGNRVGTLAKGRKWNLWASYQASFFSRTRVFWVIWKKG
jgi:hypothetical protein